MCHLYIGDESPAYCNCCCTKNCAAAAICYEAWSGALAWIPWQLASRGFLGRNLRFYGSVAKRLAGHKPTVDY